MQLTKLCDYPGCGRQCHGRDLCSRHRIQRNHGEALRPLREKGGRTRPIAPHPTDPTLALVPLTRGMWAVIDAAHSAAVSAFNWAVKVNNRPGGPPLFYAQTNGRDEDGTRGFYLHALIGRLIGLGSGKKIDHENGNGLDNRGSNLRRATSRQNAYNTRIGRRNTSGVKGVHWDRRTRKWAAQLIADGKQYWLGRFVDLKDAADAVAAKRVELHGSFANNGSEVH